MSIAACLSATKPLELVGDRLVIGVPEVTLHHELLETPEHRKLIERVISAKLSLPRVAVTFRAIQIAEVPPPTPPHPEPPAQDIVQSALKMFNAKIIQGHTAS